MNNRPRGQGSYTLGGSPLDASPYSLTGQPVSKPQYLQQRFAGSIGGQLKIPGLFDAGTRTQFFLNYSGNRSSNFYSAYSTVPTEALRRGDFSELTTAVIDPQTGEPFPGNQIPTDRLSAASLALLRFYPQPNQTGDQKNYYYSTTNRTTSDDINFRLTRSFGTATRRPGQRGAGPMGGRGGGGRGGGNGAVNLNIGIQYQRSESAQSNPFPTITGGNHRTGWNIPVSVNFSIWGIQQAVNVGFNRSNSRTSNAFAYVTNVAGDAGILGVSTDPFDWGVPTVSFATFSGLRDVTPSLNNNQTLSISDSMVKIKGRHSIRFGGDFRDVRVESRSVSNARGTFVFTGLYTGVTSGTSASGLDFADFLLGLAQQASVQYGPTRERLRTRSWNLFVQDDWRVRSNFTINAGLRYEYQAPYWEVGNQLVNLDAAPDFSAVTPIIAGQTGPYTGKFSRSLVNSDWNNLSPRIGVAWRPMVKTVVRGGYGINYASVPYMSMAQRMASQPPFAVTDTRIGTAAGALALTDAFGIPLVDTTTNNFGVDPNYRLGYVQIWNLDVQRELGRTLSVGVAYTGTKGSQLDIQRAPNRGPSGLRIAGVQPFIWESSGGRSLMNAVSFRFNRRLAQGVSGGVTYTYSKSMDNASSIGGGATVVAQNDQDLEAEWGLSSFDQRHRLTGNFSLELPFGPNRRWLTHEGLLGELFGGWMMNGTIQAASGTPFTARITGNVSDVARGTNGTLRADYTGARITVDDPTIQRFFNTAAFTIPAAGTFGNAARNTIPGPWSTTLNMALMKNFTVPGTRGVSLRLQANNVLNTPQWATVDTVVNSPTFGQVTGVRAMRSMQVVARVMF
jgi:hypothetical protein